MVFKLVGVVFPASDFQHPVVTPAVLLMGALLCKVVYSVGGGVSSFIQLLNTSTQCRVRSAVDLLHGLLLCGVMIEVIGMFPVRTFICFFCSLCPYPRGLFQRW